MLEATISFFGYKENCSLWGFLKDLWEKTLEFVSPSARLPVCPLPVCLCIYMLPAF